jgi:phosphatidylglycerol:prolipoprotein diacylglycerol transferase
MFAHEWKSVPVFSYGVMLGTSMVVGWFLALRLAKNDGIPSEQAGAIYMWTAVWAIVGARLLYVITEWQEFSNPLDIILLNKGGLVAYGGMIGGFLASWYGCYKRKIRLLRWADVSAPSVVLGITRVGCLLFGCDYGRRSNLPWAIRFPADSPAWQDHVSHFGLDKASPLSFPVHPTQIYETLASLAVFGLCMYLRRVRKFSGEVFVGWVMGYGILRSTIELFRGDADRGTVGPLSTSQFIGLVSSVSVAALLFFLLQSRSHRDAPVGAAAASSRRIGPAQYPAQTQAPLIWKPWEGFHAFPRWYAASKAGRLPTRPRMACQIAQETPGTDLMYKAACN